MTCVEDAERLYAAGLNVTPLKPASKHCFAGWRVQEGTRLYRPWLDRVFGTNVPVGIGVLVGRTSRNLFVVDCDTPESYAMISGELVTRGMATWERSSPRGGQFWFFCLDGMIENITDRAGYQVWGHDHLAVAAGSIHPDTGEVLEWRSLPERGPLELGIDDMAWLGLTLYRRRALRVEKGVLPPVADRVLVQRDVSGYASVSHAESAACWSLMGAGATDEEIEHLFARFRPPHYIKKGAAEWRRSLLVPARESFEAASRNGQNSQVARLAESVRIAIEAIPWPGVTGSSDRAVLLALVERMRLDNSLVFRASRRELALGAGVSTVTVGKALERLQAGEHPWLCLKDMDSLSGACRWSLDPENIRVKEALRNNTVASGYAPAESSVLVLNAGDDVWHRQALGKSAHLVYAALLRYQDGATHQDLQMTTGKAASTVKRALIRLSEQGLILEDAGRWYAACDDARELGEIALECGTFGARERKRARFQEERERHVTQLLLEAIEHWAATK